MAKKKGKQIAEVKIEKMKISVRASEHALERMEERKVDKFAVAGAIIALGERLEALRGQEAIVIDKEKDLAVVFGITKNTANIITVINKSNVFVKSNTVVEHI